MVVGSGADGLCREWATGYSVCGVDWTVWGASDLIYSLLCELSRITVPGVIGPRLVIRAEWPGSCGELVCVSSVGVVVYLTADSG